jgi:hypothetical protein
MLKHWVYCFVISLSVIFISCDDEEQPDIQQPVVGVEVLQNDNAVDLTDDLRGILDLKISASDNGKIKSVQVLVDGTVIKEIESVELVETEFDTRTVADGVHDVKISVSDQAGNTAEKILQVKTANLMFSYTVSSHFIQTAPQENTNVKKWLVLSDDEGVVFEYKLMPTPGIYTFQYPLDFSDAHFNVTVVDQYAHVQAQTKDFSAQTILNVTPGVYIKLQFPTGESGPFDKIHIVKKADNAAGFNFMVDSQGATNERYVGEHTELPLNIATSDMYVYNEDGAPGLRYFYYPEIRAGETTILDLNFLYNKMIPLSVHTLSSDNFDFFSLVTGVTAGGEELFCSLSGSGANPSPIALYYPEELMGNVFPRFNSLVSFKKIENGFETTTQYTKETEGFLPSIEELSAGVLGVPSKKYPAIDIALTGAADYVEVNLLRTNPADQYFSWTVTSPFSLQCSFKLPHLPSGLLSEIGLGDVPDMAIQNIRLVDQENIAAYEMTFRRWLETPVGLAYSYQDNQRNRKSKEFKIAP